MYLKLENILPGMSLGRDVVLEGVTLMSRGTEITKKMLETLCEKEIDGVYIIDGDENTERGHAEPQRIYKHSYKDQIDYQILATAKGLVTSPQVFRESIYPVVKEVITRSTEMINSLGMGVEIDNRILRRGVNTCILAVALAARFEFGNDELLSVGFASIFSDIGMHWVPKEVREKKEPLTRAEGELIKAHCRLGLDYARKYFNLPLSAYQAILDHHERWDGSGYPEGRKGENISKYARIIMVADVYDALTRGTLYRPAFSPSEALEYLMGGCGVLFDPRYVNEFVDRIEPYPVGTPVQLSDGSRGVVYAVKSNKKRPVIKIRTTIPDAPLTQRLVDLADRHHLNLTISEVQKIDISEALHNAEQAVMQE